MHISGAHHIPMPAHIGKSGNAYAQVVSFVVWLIVKSS